MKEFVIVAARKHPEKLRIVVHEAMVEHSLCRDLVKHDSAARSKLMDSSEGIQLVCDVLRGAEIGDQLIATFLAARHDVIIQIERDATRTAINIDTGVSEAEPFIETSCEGSIGVEMLEIAVDDVSRLAVRHRELRLS